MASVRQGTDAAAISWYSGGDGPRRTATGFHDCMCFTNIRYGAVPAGVRAVPETQ